MKREAWIGVAAAALAVAAMAVDHLIGTEDDGDDGTFADPWVFLGTSAGALVLTALLFRFVVRSDDPLRAPTRAIACGLVAVLSLPLLFLAVPFPFAGAAVALGLIGREGRRRGLAAAGIVLGALVLVLGVGAYTFELLAQAYGRVRIEASSVFPVDREAGFDYITNPTNWPEFWPDLVDIPDLAGARWQEPGDTMRLRMRLAGRVTDLYMTLDPLERPALVRYHTVQERMPDATHQRHFEPAAGGFEYRLVVSFAPRAGLAGLFDRTLFRYAGARALRRTLDNLAGRLTT